jgi:hypothetical protein
VEREHLNFKEVDENNVIGKKDNPVIPTREEISKYML